MNDIEYLGVRLFPTVDEFKKILDAIPGEPHSASYTAALTDFERQSGGYAFRATHPEVISMQDPTKEAIP